MQAVDDLPVCRHTGCLLEKAFDDVKTAHVQEINSLELDIENMQQANNAMRIPFDDRIRDQRDCGKE